MDIELMKFGKYLANILHFQEPNWQDIISKYHVQSFHINRSIHNINYIVAMYFNEDPVNIRTTKKRISEIIGCKQYTCYFAESMFKISRKELSNFYNVSIWQVGHYIGNTIKFIDSSTSVAREIQAIKMILI